MPTILLTTDEFDNLVEEAHPRGLSFMTKLSKSADSIIRFDAQGAVPDAQGYLEITDAEVNELLSKLRPQAVHSNQHLQSAQDKLKEAAG
jgi:hypothetical protein